MFEAYDQKNIYVFLLQMKTKIAKTIPMIPKNLQKPHDSDDDVTVDEDIF